MVFFTCSTTGIVPASSSREVKYSTGQGGLGETGERQTFQINNLTSTILAGYSVQYMHNNYGAIN